MSSDRGRREPRLLAVVTAATLLLAPTVAPGSPPPERAQEAGEAPADGPRFYPDDPVRRDTDDRHIEKPAEQSVDQLGHTTRTVLAPPGVEDRIAMNINTLGEVPDSSWFTNRQGRRDLTETQLERGPDRGGPPAPGTWTVVGHPGEGYTPKVTIEDAEGRRFLLKFELEDTPRMRSAAEVICTKFFHAFGYNVPENYIVLFDPEDLVGDPELEPEEVPAPDIETLLADVARTPDGMVRAMASLWLPGEPVGIYRYEGTRPDDPNDIFPHQHRRDLRGLRVFAAWLNHTDMKPDNTLDMYVEEDGRGFLRHYMIDFGSCLGSGATGPKDRILGHERYVEVGDMIKGVFTLGLWVPTWAAIDYPDHPSVGHLEGDVYQPWRWKTPIPIAPFMHMDAADAFWAARIAATFDDEAVAELVGTGRYGDPQQERYVVETLLKRRDKSVAYWLTRTNPLDEFRLEDDRLTWDNAAVRHDVASRPDAYRVRWYRFDNESGERTSIDAAGIDSPSPEAAVPADPWGPEDRFGLRYAVAEISTHHPDYPWWASPVIVTVRLGEDGGAEVVGVERPREMPPKPD